MQTRDDAEAGGSDSDVRVREDRTIRDIEGFASKLKIDVSLRLDMDVLEDGHVGVS